mmetsp:Transcript_33576/g.51648  ORF Transcript_33576/g.51648 Transcript_33576/m.51648 type:complete len:80 (-) Transcript_33576:2795-3034(-)
MKFILENKLGVLPYEVQENIRYYNFKERIEEVDAHKVHVANQNKKKQLQQSMAQQLDAMDKDFEDRKKFDLDNLSGIGR